MNKIPLVLALGCLGFAATTFAADGTERGERGLAALDTDGDGSVSFEEFAARQADLLARIDSDGDGVLTTAEFKAAAKASADADGKANAEADAEAKGGFWSRMFGG